ncbi:MAG: hypothetical protein WCY78_00880 [Sphaerochaetaceae bacterium]
MFKNILPSHPLVVDALSRQIEKGRLPHALLFSGPQFAGRLTLAYETARALSCELKGEEGCSCPACRSFEYFNPPNVIYAGNRNYQVRLEAALNRFKTQRTKESLKELSFNVRPLLSESQVRSNLENVGELDQLLLSLEDAPVEEYLDYEKQLRRLLKPMERRIAPLTIDTVRALGQYCRLTSLTSKVRLLILEGVEQSSLASHNSLLKLLEEPPSQTYIILISEQPSRLLSTILSRVQHHHLEAIAGVKAEVYRWANIATDELKADAKSFLDAQLLDHRALAELCVKLDGNAMIDYFKEALIDEIAQKRKANVLSNPKSLKLLKGVKEAFEAGMLYNQSSKLLLESLYYRLRED